MDDFGMELDRKQAARGITNGCIRGIIGACEDYKAVGWAFNPITMTHPHSLGGIQAIEQANRLANLDFGHAIFALCCPGHISAKRQC
jgi:hypothetical protein